MAQAMEGRAEAAAAAAKARVRTVFFMVLPFGVAVVVKNWEAVCATVPKPTVKRPFMVRLMASAIIAR
ncbi:hypothetical protein GmRootA79_14590 [Acidovorax sp. A79]